MIMAAKREIRRKGREKESLLLSNTNLVVEFAKKILVHFLIGIQDITVLKDVESERRRGNSVVVFHGTREKQLQGRTGKKGDVGNYQDLVLTPIPPTRERTESEGKAQNAREGTRTPRESNQMPETSNLSSWIEIIDSRGISGLFSFTNLMKRENFTSRA